MDMTVWCTIFGGLLFVSLIAIVQLSLHVVRVAAATKEKKALTDEAVSRLEAAVSTAEASEATLAGRAEAAEAKLNELAEEATKANLALKVTRDQLEVSIDRLAAQQAELEDPLVWMRAGAYWDLHGRFADILHERDVWADLFMEKSAAYTSALGMMEEKHARLILTIRSLVGHHNAQAKSGKVISWKDEPPELPDTPADLEAFLETLKTLILDKAPATINAALARREVTYRWKLTRPADLPHRPGSEEMDRALEESESSSQGSAAPH